MNLSKSRYCRGLQCKKMLWLEKNKPEVMEEETNEDILEQGNAVHEVARYLFGEHVNITYNDLLSEMIKDTYRTMESYKDVVITEASFNYDKNFCSVDILKKTGDKYEIYEVKSSTELKDIYINDAAYQYYVLTSLGLNVTKVSVIIINKEYLRQGDIDLEELFLKNDITAEVIHLQPSVIKNVAEINEYLLEETEPIQDVDMNCFNPYNCAFFKYCTRHLPENNIFNIAIMHKDMKMKLYHKGIYTYDKLLEENINEKYKQQIEYDTKDLPDHIDKQNINKFLDELTYPLYFLDFETFTKPIPIYDKMHPYEKIPFQYSLHYIETENGPLEHKEFLGDPETDPRYELAKRLVEDIPENTCVLAYNMGFEKGVIKRLAETFPEFSDHLMNIYGNIKDLMVPFRNRSYYAKDMHGSYSIKYVLPALFPSDPSLNYHNLDLIHNGAEAMSSYSDMIGASEEEIAYIRERLLRYCELDTYAMVKIYNKLKEKVK